MTYLSERAAGLYDPRFEHDACGIGAVVDIKGRKSHQTVSDALTIVEHLEHRAGKDAEGRTGDGVGILLQISHTFFSKVAEEMNISLGGEREYGVGMFFFPQDEHQRARAMKLFELVTRKEGLTFLAWRKVPVQPDILGSTARGCMPSIWQCFIRKPAKVSRGIDFDRGFQRQLCGQPVQPHHRLQGDVPGGAAAPLLPRPAGRGL